MTEDKSHVGMYNCFFCLKPMGVLLDRQLRNSLPRNAGVINLEPCDECQKHMEQGAILISIRDSTNDGEMEGPIPNPYRTGGWCVVKPEGLEKVMPQEYYNWAKRNRFLFLTDQVWDKLGLPRGDKPQNPAVQEDNKP